MRCVFSAALNPKVVKLYFTPEPLPHYVQSCCLQFLISMLSLYRKYCIVEDTLAKVLRVFYQKTDYLDFLPLAFIKLASFVLHSV